MNIAVRDDLQRWAEDRVDSGTYASADELINTLLEQAVQESEQADWINAELAKGRQSGPGRPAADVMREMRLRFAPDNG